MIILSVNAGSSSLKFTGFEMPSQDVLISGVFERIGVGASFYTLKFNGEKVKKEQELNNQKEAFELLVKELIDNNAPLDILRFIVNNINILFGRVTIDFFTKNKYNKS